MEKEDLKILNKGGEEEMVWHSHSNSLFFFNRCLEVDLNLQEAWPLFIFSPLAEGAPGLLFVPLASGPGGPRGAVLWGLPSPAALLVARVVRQIHLHSHHGPWCWCGASSLHGRWEPLWMDFFCFKTVQNEVINRTLVVRPDSLSFKVYLSCWSSG